eukprot:736672-Pyramimonas_sp.AAC.1
MLAPSFDGHKTLPGNGDRTSLRTPMHLGSMTPLSTHWQTKSYIARVGRTRFLHASCRVKSGRVSCRASRSTSSVSSFPAIMPKPVTSAYHFVASTFHTCGGICR